MVNAQEYIKQNYPQDKRSEVKELNISNQHLEGDLDLSDFVNLEELNCSNNDLTNTIFLSTLPKSKSLIKLDLRNNNFVKQDLSFLSGFIYLMKIYLGASNESKKNNFVGSLECLKNLTRLEELDLSNTEVDSNWWHLSTGEIKINFKNNQNWKIEEIRKCIDEEFFYEGGEVEIVIEEMNSAKSSYWLKKGPELEKELDNRNKELSDSKNRLVLLEDHKKVSKKKNELEKELEKFKNVLRELVGNDSEESFKNLDGIKNKIEDQLDKIKSLKGEIKNKDKKISEAKEVVKNDDQDSELKNKIKELENDKKSLQAQLSSKQGELKKLEEGQNLNEEISDLKASLNIEKNRFIRKIHKMESFKGEKKEIVKEAREYLKKYLEAQKIFIDNGMGSSEWENAEKRMKEAEEKLKKTGLTLKQLDSNAFKKIQKNILKKETELKSWEQEMENLREDLHEVEKPCLEEEYPIGEGGYGKVYRGKWRLQDVAVKKLHLSPHNTSNSDLKDIKKEVNILRELKNRYIIQYYGFYSDDQQLLIIMDYAENGTLTKFINDNKDKEHNWSFQKELVKQMALGLTYIHRQKTIHRDLKSMNILLTGNNEIKISDFGLSRTRNISSSHSKHEVAGTIRWMAPEILNEPANPKMFSEQSDIYALGMIIWEIAAKCTTPFKDIAVNNLVGFCIINGGKEEIPSNTPKNIQNIIQQCWKDNPSERISLEKIVEKTGADKSELQAINDDDKLLSVENPPKSKSSEEIAEKNWGSKKLDINDFDSNQLNFQKDSREENSSQAQIETPPSKK